LALLGALSASAASAAQGVYEAFGPVSNSATGGAFKKAGTGGAADVAVNKTGAGGVEPGEIYLVDRGFNRIQRFDADGGFVSAWGQDVDTAGGNGFEICVAAANCKTGITTAQTGGALSSPWGIAVNQQTGHVYVSNAGFRRIEEYSATGSFVRAWGKDIVKTGQPGDNPAASAVQTLTVSASGGKYLLEFAGQKTGDLPFNASAAELTGALGPLPAIGVGNIEVTGAGPYTITFKGGHAMNPEPTIVAASTAGDPLVGGTAAVVSSVSGSNGFEICEVAADCQASPGDGGTAGAFGRSGSQAVNAIAVAPVGAPNAGGVMVADGFNRRVQEFSGTGDFLRAFGWDVVAAGPGNDSAGPINEFEVCVGASSDACKPGSSGDGIGQYSGGSGADLEGVNRGPNGIAEDSSGNIYTVESASNFRVQKFNLPGNVVTPLGTVDSAELSGSFPVNATQDADTPIDVAVDSSTPPGTPGTLFVLKYVPKGAGQPPLDAPESRVFEVDPAGNGGSGKVTGVLASGAGIGHLSNAAGLAVNESTGRIYVTDVPGNSGASAFLLDEVPAISLQGVAAQEVGSTTAKLVGSILPSALPNLHTLYHFEYARVGTAGACGESASGWIRTPLIEGDVGNGTSSVSVAAAIANLAFEGEYEFCLVAHTVYNGAVSVAHGVFVTHPTPPAVSTGKASWSSPGATHPSLLLGGIINPGYARTTYHFEYVEEATYLSDKAAGGNGFEHSVVAPRREAEAGRGSEDVSIRQAVAGLDTTKRYAYRLVGSNPVAEQAGEAQFVDPPADGGRYYELVSVGDSWGSGLGADVGPVAASGGRAMFAAQAFGQPPSLPGPSTPFVSTRSSSGWVVGSMLARVDNSSDQGLGGLNTLTARGLGASLWPESTVAERQRGEVQFGISRIDGTRSTASSSIAPASRTGLLQGYNLRGASQDLSSFVFGVSGDGSATYFPDETGVNAGAGYSNLYEVSGSTMKLVNRANGVSGAVIGGRCGAGLGANLGPVRGNATHAVSDDGSVVYFTARPAEAASGTCNGSSPKRIFKRINGETTVEVSAPACSPTPACPGSPTGNDSYQGASADGAVTFFTTPRRLTNSDGDATADLYLYDATPPAGQAALIQASKGESVSGHPTPGAGADVQGVLDSSVDGSRVYFVAKGVLTGPNGESKSPVATKPNLYVFERNAAHPEGRLVFVGALDPLARQDSNSNAIGDPLLWSEVGSNGNKSAVAVPMTDGSGGGDGHILLFASFAKLAAVDLDDAKDLYRFDDSLGQMVCLSCAGEGGSGNGSFDVSITARNVLVSRPDYAEQAAIASADASTVVFATAEKLDDDDVSPGVNLTCTANASDVQGCDVYAWHNGSIELITGGTEGVGISAPSLSPAAVSADGRDVFFVTRAPLVASDTNSADDLYDARIGGGFPAEQNRIECVGTEECQGSPLPPPVPATPASPSFQGSGNVPPPPPTCKKGQVRRNGKCVKKKKAKHRRSQKQRAHNRQGANR
jgi:hypothetical protein